MAKKHTEEIILWGDLIGRGFGEFVSGLAENMLLPGRMVFRGVSCQIVVSGAEKRINEFVQRLVSEKPAQVEIVYFTRLVLAYKEFFGFTMLNAPDQERPVTIPNDRAVCDDCLAEARDPDDRRYMDPYISCNNCGPGYSILRSMPFERENTTMASFEMCALCREEYDDTLGRRYAHADIGCLNCGPEIDYRMNGDHLSEKSELEKAAALLKEGSVIALKGTGGYDLVANPLDSYALGSLRKIKEQYTKPFPIMFHDMDQIRKFNIVSENEAALLLSSARPIVQLVHKSQEELQDEHPANYDEIMKSPLTGAMLPDSADRYILLELFGGPLIFTSANRSGRPMIRDDSDMARMLAEEPLIAEMFYHHRNIAVSLDDSVVRVIDDQPQIMKRSKGYVPLPVYINRNRGKILAFGGDRSGGFSLSDGKYVYMSQVFGDLAEPAKRKRFGENIEHLSKMLDIRPEAAVCEMDEKSISAAMAEEKARQMDIPLIRIQHHHAHLAAVIAEHDIHGQVTGVCFDGPAPGIDGNCWGGEFFLCDGDSFERMCHMSYMEVPMRPTRHQVAGFLFENESKQPDIGEADIDDGEFRFDLHDVVEYAELYNTMDDDEEEPYTGSMKKTSSVLKLIDGVVHMLGLDKGEDAMRSSIDILEEAAACYLDGNTFSEAYRQAYGFVMSMAETVADICTMIRRKTGSSRVILTGEVFRNRHLVRRCIELLKGDGFEVCFSNCAGPGDGCLALGQSFLASVDNYRSIV